MRIHSNHRLPWGRILSTMLIAAAISFLASCGDNTEGDDGDITSASKPETPTQVVEAFYNSLDEDDCNEALKYLEYEGLQDEQTEIEVFIKNSASQGEIETLGEEIRSMVEVESVIFISKEEALLRLKSALGDDSDVLKGLTDNPLPASYLITIRDPANLAEVASRFFNNPLVDNTPGSDPPDGVKYSRNPDMWGVAEAVSASCRSLLSEYDYEISEFKVVDESINEDEATVTFRAVVSIDGIESTPDEFNMKMHKSGEAWKIDYFKSLWSMKGASGFFSLLLINNEAQVEKIEALPLGTYEIQSQTVETITMN